MSKLLILLATLIGFEILVGCDTAKPPPDDSPVFGSVSAVIESAVETNPEDVSNLRKAISAAESNYKAGDFKTTVDQLSIVMHGFSREDDDVAALKLKVAIALEKDLHLQAAKGKDRVTSENELNFKCEGGDTFNCVVQRGCYCNRLYLDGKLVGCGGGKFPGTPPGTC